MSPEIPTAGICGRCGVQLVTRHRWDSLPLPERARLRALHLDRKARHGECDKCNHARRRGESLGERTWRRREETFADWEFLVDRSRSLGANIRDLAPRMGMSANALEKALARSGVKAWPVGSTVGWDEWAS